MDFNKARKILKGSFLFEPNLKKQKQVIQELGTISNNRQIPEAKQILYEYINDKKLQEDVIDSLINLTITSDDFFKLVEFIANENNPIKLREKLLFKIRETNHKDAIKTLKEIFEASNSDEFRFEIINQLFLIEVDKKNDALNAIKELLDKNSHIITVKILAKITQIESSLVAPYLAYLTSNKKQYETYFIVTWFAEHPEKSNHPDVYEALVDLIDTTPQLEQKAKQAIENIWGERLVDESKAYLKAEHEIREKIKEGIKKHRFNIGEEKIEYFMDQYEQLIEKTYQKIQREISKDIHKKLEIENRKLSYKEKEIIIDKIIKDILRKEIMLKIKGEYKTKEQFAAVQELLEKILQSIGFRSPRTKEEK